MRVTLSLIGRLSVSAVVILLLCGGAYAGGTKSRIALSPSGADADASGTAMFKARGGHNGASLRIQVSGLDGGKGFKVLCDAAHVADLSTDSGGKARARMRAGNRRSGNAEPLDFDPGACTLVVADVDGTPILAGDLPSTDTDEPSASVSPSVSPFDGNPDDDSDVSPTASPSASPVEGGDGDGTDDDEPSVSASPSVSETGDEPAGAPGEPSPTASASASEDDVSASVSDDEQPSPSPAEGADEEDASPSPSDDDDDSSGSGSDDDGDDSSPGSGS